MDRLRHHNPWWGRFLGKLSCYFIKTTFPIIFLMMAKGCREDQSVHECWSKVQFVDSSYLNVTTEYFVGDTVYILCTGNWHGTFPDTVSVLVYGSDRDTEEVYARSTDMPIDTLINPRYGKISTIGDSNYQCWNGILEVNPAGDTIFAFFSLTPKGSPYGNIGDTACIKPKRHQLKQCVGQQ